MNKYLVSVISRKHHIVWWGFEYGILLLVKKLQWEETQLLDHVRDPLVKRPESTRGRPKTSMSTQPTHRDDYTDRRGQTPKSILPIRLNIDRVHQRVEGCPIRSNETIK